MSICHQSPPTSSGTWAISAWQSSFNRVIPANAAFFLEKGHFPMGPPISWSLVLNLATKMSDVHFLGHVKFQQVFIAFQGICFHCQLFPPLLELFQICVSCCLFLYNVRLRRKTPASQALPYPSLQRGLVTADS